MIDQTTNDPRTVLPVTLGALGANMSWLLPSSAHGQGKNGAFYTTDLTLVRTRSSTAATVTLKFLGHEKDGRTGPEAIRTIPGNGAIALTDVLGSVFGISSDYGSILVKKPIQGCRVVRPDATRRLPATGRSVSALPALRCPPTSRRRGTPRWALAIPRSDPSHRPSPLRPP